MSDFDPEDIISEQPPMSDFDPGDIVNESAMQMEPQEEAPITVSGVPIVEPVAGYAAGRATQEAISKTGELAEKGLEKVAQLGGTSPEQLRNIKQNFPEFKATDPIAEMNKLLEAARGTNVDVNRMYAEAEKLLADKKITPDEYASIVERAALEQNKYGQPTFARPMSQSEISKTLQPAIESTSEIVKTKQEKLLEEFADLKAKEAVAKASEQSLGVLDEKTAKNIAKTTKEQVLQNPQSFDFKGMSAPEVLPIFEQEREKLIKGKETSLSEVFPSLKGASIVPAEERAFQKILKMPSKADIPGNRLQEMLREFRDVGFTEGGQLSDKPAASMSREVRKEIAKLSPEAGKLMEAENVELNKLEALENAGYIKRQGEGIKTTVEMTDAQRNKVIKDLATAYDQASPTDVVENLQVLKDYLPEDQFKKLQLAGMKLAEKRGGGVDYINANKINAILQSITKRSVSRGVATLPEAISTALPRTTAITKSIGKGAMKALPIVGAGVGGIAAQAAEEALSPEPSGATPQMEEYWLERGVRDPEEQRQRALLASFKEELPAQGQVDEMPSAYEKPEIRQRKEQVMAAKKAGALAPTYVEAPLKKVLKADNPAEIASVAQALQSGQDKASQEYGRVLSQIVDAPASQKEAILFGLNQQPAFRDLVRKLKDEQKTEEETPLMLKGPA
jgi:hypothetical protein